MNFFSQRLTRTLFLLLAIAMLFNCTMAMAYQKSDRRPGPPQIDKQSDTKHVVFNLKHRVAEEILRIASQFSSSEIRIVSDVISNSLIVSYATREQEQFNKLKNLIEMLDVEGNPKEKLMIVSYPLGDLGSKLGTDLVQMLFRDSPVRASYYDSTNSLIVYATEKQHEEYQKVLSAIQQRFPESPKEPSQSRDILLVATMIVDGNQINEAPGKNHSAPNARLKSVISKTIERGLANMETPLVVSQSVNRISVLEDAKNFPFSNTSSSLPTSRHKFEFRIEGNLTGSMENRVNLELNIQISSVGDSGKSKSDIRSRVQTKLGKPIILGLAKIDGVDTLIAIEVFAED